MNGLGRLAELLEERHQAVLLFTLHGHDMPGSTSGPTTPSCTSVISNCTPNEMPSHSWVGSWLPSVMMSDTRRRSVRTPSHAGSPQTSASHPSFLTWSMNSSVLSTPA